MSAMADDEFPANVRVVRFTDLYGPGINLDIRGETRLIVEAEVERVTAAVTRRRANVQMIGPVQYWPGAEWVAFCVVREGR